MELTDRILKCVDCGQEFVFGTGEQVFFKEKGFQHEPRHCKKCKAKFTNKRGRVETSVTSSECGAPTTVPFVPRMGRPVLCRSCFQRSVATDADRKRFAGQGSASWIGCFYFFSDIPFGADPADTVGA